MQTIYLDISSKGVYPCIQAKQGDIGRKFKLVFTDVGIPYNIPAGSVLSVFYSGASGEGNYTDIGDKSAFSVSENIVEVEMITQMLSNSGDGLICLVLNNPSGGQIGTWNIPYISESVPGADSEAAKSYYTAFSHAIKEFPYPDTSLSVSGKAADAKAVGDKLSAIIKITTSPNLLDNSDFTNPVNQREKTSLVLNDSDYQFFIDRWRVTDWSGNDDGFVQLTSSGISVSKESAYFYQRFDKGYFNTLQNHTLVIYYADGTKEIRYSENMAVESLEEYDQAWFSIEPGKTVAQVALYEGKYNKDSVGNYSPKGYSTEFSECCRYYLRLIHAWSNGSRILGEGLNVRLNCPVQMRVATPTAEINSLEVFTDTSQWVETTLQYVIYRGGGMYDISMVPPENTQSGLSYLVRGINALSAEL